MDKKSLKELKNFYSSLGVSGLKKYVDDFISNNNEIELDVIERHLYGETILDLGCGYGRLTSVLAKRGYNVVGIDICGLFICESKKNNPELTFIEANMENIPIEDSYFDGVISMFGVFNDIIDRPIQLRCLSEIQRVLKRGGNAIIELPYLEKTRHIQEMVKSYAKKHGKRYDGGGGLIEFSDKGKFIGTYIYSKEEMTNLMLETGFRQIEYDEFVSNLGPRLVVIGEK